MGTHCEKVDFAYSRGQKITEMIHFFLNLGLVVSLYPRALLELTCLPTLEVVPILRSDKTCSLSSENGYTNVTDKLIIFVAYGTKCDPLDFHCVVTYKQLDLENMSSLILLYH